MPKISTLRRPDQLAAIADAQERVVGRAQLAAAGYDRNAVRRMVAAEQWQVIGLAVLLHGGDITSRHRQWACVLSAPRLVVLTGRSAARAYGLRGFDPDVIDALVPETDDPVGIDGVRWHRSRRLAPSDVTRFRGLPFVRRARAIVDAARWTSSPRIACALLAAAVQQRVVPATALLAELELCRNVRHRGHLLAVARDVAGGADSLAEIDFTKLARQAGLPPPIRQSIRLDSDGRRRYLDADFGAFSVEVDGGLHLLPLNYWADAHRQNDLVIGGDRILRFPSVAFRLEQELVVAQLRRAGIAFGLIES